MDKKKSYYITSPIYYPNGKFHIGTCYTTFLGDTVKKYKLQRGFDAYFVTGNDEHGQKIQDAAKDAGLDPQTFVDQRAQEAKDLWDKLGIDYDYFVRTTEPRHKEQVKKVVLKFLENGDIYKDKYLGNYCKSCESYFTNSQLVNGDCCPDCGKKTVLMEEEAYFFNMKKYVPRLLEYYEKHPDFILPVARKNEIVSNFLEPGLDNLCITRSTFDWGIKFPGDEKHVLYVWLDALTNYLTNLGAFEDDDSKYKRYWPASLQIVGKDIIRFHGIYWPIFLMALGIELPKTIFAHNWYVTASGKMSKSKGNVIYPEELVDELGTDVVRYVLLKNMPYTHDGILNRDEIVDTYNTYLCNDYSNLVFRTIGMIKKYSLNNMFVDSKESLGKEDKELLSETKKAIKEFEKEFEKLNIQKAIETLQGQISNINKYIDVVKPWELFKEENVVRLEVFAYTILNAIRMCTIAFEPILPNTTAQIAKDLGFTQEQMEYSKENLDDLPIQISVNESATPIFQRLEKQVLES